METSIVSTPAQTVKHLGNSPLSRSSVTIESEHTSVKAQGPSLGYVWADAFSPLVLSGKFDPSATTSVVFADRSGRKFRASADDVTSSTVSVTVPVFLRPRNGLVSTGGFHVSVLQDSGSRTHRTPVIFHLQVRKPASTGLPPGTLVSVVLADMQGVVLDQIQKAQAVAALSNGAVDVSGLVSNLQGQAAALSVQRQALLPLINGDVSQVVLASPGGKPLAFTRRSLALMDQVVAAPFQSSSAVHSASTAGVTSTAKALAMASVDYVSAINKFFSNIVHLPTAQEIKQAEKVQSQWLSNAKVFAAELSVGGALVGGPVGFAVGSDIGGSIVAGVWIATSLAPYLGPATGNEASLNDVLSGNVNQQDKNANLQFAFGVAYDAATGKSIDKLVELALKTEGPSPLGSALGVLYDKLGDFVKESIKDESQVGGSANSIASSVTNANQLPAGTASQSTGPQLGGSTSEAPAIGVSATGLSGTVTQFTSSISGSFTVQNIGGGSLDMFISANSDLIHVSTAKQADGTGLVTVTVGTLSLAPGSYSGSITISSPNASNSPQVVSISLLVVPPAQSPTLPWAPPTYQPPIYQPPVFQPPTYQPPIYQPPSYTPPSNQPPENPTPSDCTFTYDYRLPGYDYLWAGGVYATVDEAMADIQRTLDDYRQAGDPNDIPTDFRIFEDCDGQRQLVQTIQVH